MKVKKLAKKINNKLITVDKLKLISKLSKLLQGELIINKDSCETRIDKLLVKIDEKLNERDDKLKLIEKLSIAMIKDFKN